MGPLTVVQLLTVAWCCQAVKIVWDNDVEVDLNEIDDDFGRSGERKVPNWFFIFPGKSSPSGKIFFFHIQLFLFSMNIFQFWICLNL